MSQKLSTTRHRQGSHHGHQQAEKSAEESAAEPVVSNPDDDPATSRTSDDDAAPSAATPASQVSKESFLEEQIRHLAYELWEGRDRPLGEPEVDWFKAKLILFGHQES